MLEPGDPAPWFHVRSTVNPNFAFDTAAGRYVVLCFFGSAAHPGARRILEDIEREHARFDVFNACFCGVSADPDDERQGRLRQQWPGVIYFWDFDRAVARQFGVAEPGRPDWLACSLILDPALRVVGIVPFDDSPQTHVSRIIGMLNQLPPVTALTDFAPVLQVPYVFEPELCRELIDLYERHGGQELGMLREVEGQTVRVHDHSQKKRADYTITEPPILEAIRSRLTRRVFPAIQRAFQFRVTQIERYIVACYDGGTGGYFRAHRDDNTRGSAHRRFAVTINLNTPEYEGGELRFPEYGVRTYRAPAGAATVFSCTMLHEVRPVTKGRRFAFLPFLFDDSAAAIRAANQQFVSADLRQT